MSGQQANPPPYNTITGEIHRPGVSAVFLRAERQTLIEILMLHEDQGAA